jgi:hypothetical protein
VTPGGLNGHSAINPFAETISPLPVHEEQDSPVRPGDSISAHQESDNPFDVAAPFAFKFKAPSGKIHRLAFAAASGLEPLRQALTEKLGADDLASLTQAFGVSYVDDDGDVVSITCNEDLLESVKLAKRAKRDKVDLYLHHPDKAAVTAPTPQQQHLSRGPSRLSRQGTGEAEEALLPAEAIIPEKKQSEATESKGTSSGSTNDLLIPGALVVLAIAIVGVFAVSRASK